MVILPVLPSKLQLYLSHVRSPGHFIRSKWSKWINEIRKCDINIVNDLIVTYMIILCAAYRWISRWHIQSIPTRMVKIKQLHAVMDLETFLWLSEDDKMMECPVWCVPRVVTGDCKYAADHQRPDNSDTGNTWHAPGPNIIYVLVTRAVFKHRQQLLPCVY